MSIAHQAEAGPILLRDDRDGIATLTLNRPAQRNALSRDLMAALQAELEAIGGDRSVKVVVLAANGPAFCAGHDLKEVRSHRDEPFFNALFEKFSELRLTFARVPQAVLDRGPAPDPPPPAPPP